LLPHSYSMVFSDYDSFVLIFSFVCRTYLASSNPSLSIRGRIFCFLFRFGIGYIVSFYSLDEISFTEPKLIHPNSEIISLLFTRLSNTFLKKTCIKPIKNPNKILSNKFRRTLGEVGVFLGIASDKMVTELTGKISPIFS